MINNNNFALGYSQFQEESQDQLVDSKKRKRGNEEAEGVISKIQKERWSSTINHYSKMSTLELIYRLKDCVINKDWDQVKDLSQYLNIYQGVSYTRIGEIVQGFLQK